MGKKTIVYIGNGIGTRIEKVLTELGHEVVSLTDIEQFVRKKRMDLIIADNLIEKCTEGEKVKCTMDDVVFARNRIFPGVPLVIYTDDESVSRYYSNRGYTVLPKSEDLESLKAMVKGILGGRTV